MSMIQVKDLTFGYNGNLTNVFENVSFQIDTDWKLGFIGRNGKGKTTFLNLLLGKYEYKGSISHSVSFDYFPFDVTDTSRNPLMIAEKIVSHMEEWKFIKELSLLEVTDDVLYRPFFTLSQGEQVKIMLACLFLKQGSFLLLDEPTNHLDAEARRAVQGYLNKKKGFILVSHDRTLLDGCADHILSINKSNIEVQRGNFSSWQHNRELKNQFELAENEKLKQEIGKLSSSAKRSKGWSDTLEKTKNGTRNSGLRPDRGFVGHKSAKIMKRAKSIESRRDKALEEKSYLLKDVDSCETLTIQPLAYRKQLLFDADSLSVSYGERKLFENLRFTIEQGDRIALNGANGSGKSSLIKLIMGHEGEGSYSLPEYTGNLHVGSGLCISYISQDTSHLHGDLKQYAEDEEIDESLFKAILRKLDFSRELFLQEIKDYSEGQKKKVLLARSMCQKAHLYVWDEPLNYIDVLSRIQIEELILQCSPTIIFVEHDQVFCKNIATKYINL